MTGVQTCALPIYRRRRRKVEAAKEQGRKEIQKAVEKARQDAEDKALMAAKDKAKKARF